MPTADTEEGQATGRAQGTLLRIATIQKPPSKGTWEQSLMTVFLTQPVWQITAVLAPSARH